MTTTTELPLKTDADSALALYHAAMLDTKPAASGDTSTPLENDGAPTTVTDADKKPAEEVKTAPSVERQDASNTVLMAKDGKHTIDFAHLEKAREQRDSYKAQAEAAQQELALLQAAAQARADNGEAPTKTDAMVAQAEAAIDAGADISLFGDFSEEGMAAGIKKSVRTEVEQARAEMRAEIEAVLQPLRQQQQLSAADAHIGAVLDAHPDAGSICQSVELDNWIKAQPSYLQPAMRQVQEKGSTAAVIELIGNFKAATGATQPTAPSHKQAAQEAIARVTAPIPASLSDIPGGRPGDVTLNDRMAAMSEIDMFNAVNSGAISQAQLDTYLNRKS